MVPLPRVPPTLQAVIKENSSLYYQLVLANRVRDETLRKYLTAGAGEFAMTSTNIFMVLRELDIKRIFVLAAIEDMNDILVLAWRLLERGGNMLHWLSYEGQFDILFVAVANQSWKVVEFYLGGYFESNCEANLVYQKTLAPIVDEWILMSNIMHYIACDDVERFLVLMMKYRPHLFMDTLEVILCGCVLVCVTLVTQGLQLRNEFSFERRYVVDLVRTSVSLAQFRVLDWVHKNMPSEFDIQSLSTYNIGNYISRCEDYGEYGKVVKMIKWFWKNAPEHIWRLTSCQDGLMYRGCKCLINSVNVNAERLRFKSIAVLRELAGDSFFDRSRYQLPPWHCMFSGIVSMYISDHVKFVERFGEIEEMPFIKLYETATKRLVDVTDADLDGNTILHYLFDMAVLTKADAPTKDDHCVVQFIVARIIMYLELNRKDFSGVWRLQNREGKTPLDMAGEHDLRYLIGFARGVQRAGSVFEFVRGSVCNEDDHLRCLQSSMSSFLLGALNNGGPKRVTSLMMPKRCGNYVETMNSVPNRPNLMTPFSLGQAQRLVDFMHTACVKWEEFMNRSNFELTDEKIDTIVKTIEGSGGGSVVPKKKRNSGKKKGRAAAVKDAGETGCKEWEVLAGVDLPCNAPDAVFSQEFAKPGCNESEVLAAVGKEDLEQPAKCDGKEWKVLAEAVNPDAAAKEESQQESNSEKKKKKKGKTKVLPSPCAPAAVTGVEEPGESCLEDKPDGCCVVCFVERCTHAYIPCGHMAVCQGCSELYSKKCVICNQNCVMCVKIFEHSV